MKTELGYPNAVPSDIVKPLLAQVEFVTFTEQVKKSYKTYFVLES